MTKFQIIVDIYLFFSTGHVIFAALNKFYFTGMREKMALWIAKFAILKHHSFFT